MTEEIQEYDEGFTTLLEAVWGEGFLSPGGTEEVNRYLTGVNLSAKKVLDIGCGLGGIDIHLIKHHGAAKVVGIDVDIELVNKCTDLAARNKVSDKAEFILVEPGPLPFPDSSFDIVTSKDSIIHITDKQTLAADIYRVLEPGGYFAASDWLAGYDGDPSPEMEEYLISEGLDFGLASAGQYQQAFELAGFVDIEIIDRNDWYKNQARNEHRQLSETLFDSLQSKIGKELLEHEIEVWDKMIVALDQGQLRPTHLRARKE